MTCLSTVELTELEINTDIGTYKPGDVVPTAHLLDMTLAIDPSLVLIEADNMNAVFDYDPLIAEIDRLGRDGNYETQERLMTRIVMACAAYQEIQSLEIYLRKYPVLKNSGALGVRLIVDTEDLKVMRQEMEAN
ncbi:MAG: dihydroneopterin aldolase [Pseudomonadota bacterium]